MMFEPNIEKMRKNKDLQGIIQASTNKLQRIRYEAAIALGDFIEPSAVEALSILLSDEDWGVLHNSAKSLERIGIVAYPGLLKATQNKYKKIQLLAIDAFRNNCDKRATDRLIELLGNKDSDIQVAAINALGEIRDEKAIEPLKELFGNVRLRTWAARAIIKIGGMQCFQLIIDAILTEKDSGGGGVYMALPDFGPQAVNPIIDAILAHEDDWRFISLVVLKLTSILEIHHISKDSINPRVLPWIYAFEKNREEMIKLGDSAAKPLLVILEQAKDSSDRDFATGLLEKLSK